MAEAFLRHLAGDAFEVPSAGTIVEDGNVFWSYITDESVQHKANCTIPVHGPKGAGTARVQIVARASSLDPGACLDVGGQTIPIDS